MRVLGSRCRVIQLIRQVQPSLRIAKVTLAVCYFGCEQDVMSSDKSQKATSVS